MYKHVKRVFDIFAATIAAVILSPIMVVTAIAIKLDSPGPVIFKQDRLGLGGKVFRIYKFRSMCQGAEHFSEVPVLYYILYTSIIFLKVYLQKLFIFYKVYAII